MWSRILKGSAIVAIVFAAGIGVSACGGDDDGGGGDEVTLEEYFERLEAASITFTEESDAAADELGSSEEIDSVKDAIALLPPIVEHFVNDISALNPPEEAQEAHDAAVEAGENFSEAVNGVLDELGDVESIEDLEGVVSTDALDEASGAFTAACEDLQTLADENNIEVDLDCGDGDA